jgi:DNA repair exonuclease SbcCD ATPase subunit
MDDPTQSMDREHKEALAKVIHSLSQSKQVVVATQDSELSDVLNDTCKERVHSYEINSWTIDGPIMAARPRKR